MSAFGGSYQYVSLQPGAPSARPYKCPVCKRVGLARIKPECLGSVQHPHNPATTEVVDEKHASKFDPNDPPVYR